MDVEKLNGKLIVSVTLVAAMGGLLFGYDWVVIGGAKPFYERFFDITHSASLQGWAMSSALIGCVFGALFSGQLSDRYGRKIPLIVAAALFLVSAIGTGATQSFTPFVLYRLLGGFGIGLASAISPMYIAEISPAHLRGRLVSVNQLTIVIGILAAQITNYLIAEVVPQGTSDEVIRTSWNGQMGWRWMFWAEGFPAALFLMLAFLIPESPRFLAKKGEAEGCLKILSRIGGKAYAQSEMKNILHTLKDPSSKIDWKALLEKKVRSVLIIGIVITAFQQWCGINVIFNYADEIFSAAGYSVSDMLFNIVITGTVNLIFTLIAMRVVDSWGRRKLMLLGAAGLAIIYLLLGSSYFLHIHGISILVLIVMAIAVYAFTLAPVVWVVLSEIFPNRIRGAAMAVGTTSLWIACFILTYTFPLLNKTLNAWGTFWLYALICFLGFLFIYKKLPETKNKSLEEIENLLIK